MNQDFVAWVGQGAIADRTGEHLGESDRGVIMMRRRLLEQAEVVQRGGEPKAVVRDAERNRCIGLPIIDRNRYVNGFPQSQIYPEIAKTPGPILPEGFVFLAGQPEEVRSAYRRAMGLDTEPARDVRARG
jgi:5,5'-dehydrodivanillate O-demethylase